MKVFDTGDKININLTPDEMASFIYTTGILCDIMHEVLEQKSHVLGRKSCITNMYEPRLSFSDLMAATKCLDKLTDIAEVEE